MKEILSSKIHKATVTESNLNYTGSITIDEELLRITRLWPGQKVLIVDNTNGARLETYVIVGKRYSGIICMNGAAAHLVKKGDQVTIMGFEFSNKPIIPRKILVDNTNRFERWL